MEALVRNIKVDEETWKELSRQKINLGLSRISDVIKHNLIESSDNEFWERLSTEAFGSDNYFGAVEDEAWKSL